MKRVYLIRHGLPDFPQGQRMCLGRTDLPLSATGLAQARDMAASLPPVSAVFSSPLQRALQTARAIGSPIVVEDLQELFAGDWDGLLFAEIQQRYPELYAARGITPGLPLPNGESDESGLHRFSLAMKRAAAMAYGDFAVVSHGGVIRLFLRSLGAQPRKPAYAEVVPLIYKHGTFILQEEIPHA